MKQKESGPQGLSSQEIQFAEQLRSHPVIAARFQSILATVRNAEGPLKTFDEVEGLVVAEMRQLGKAAVCAWAVRAEERVGQELKAQDPTVRSRKKKTLGWWCVFGWVAVRDRVWRSRSRSYIRPLPGRLGVTPRGLSRRLQRVLTDFGCEHSFAKVVARVGEHYGFEINASAVRKTTLEHAKRARQKLEEHYAKPFRTLPAAGPKHIVAELDGTMICTVASGRRKGKKPREWKEMRLAAAQVLGKAETVYAATFGEVGEVGRRLGHCARDAGRGLESRVHTLGDGAEWIRLQTREVFGEKGTFLCDYYHVSEYLAGAAPGCRAEAPDRWRRTQQARLKRGASAKVIQELAGHLEPEGAPEGKTPVRDAHRYLANRTDCIDYPGAIRMGLPIGSGMIESAHRHVLQARLKGAGTTWLPEHADRIANLRVLRANGKWPEFWN